MQQNYERNWEEYLHFRNIYIAALISYLPAVVLVGYLGYELLLTWIPGILTASVGMVILAFTGGRVVFWPCPRCGEWFSRTMWYHLDFLARRCVHCGLPKYAKTAEKYIRPGELHLTN